MLKVAEFARKNGAMQIWLRANRKARAYKFYMSLGYVDEKEGQSSRRI